MVHRRIPKADPACCVEGSAKRSEGREQQGGEEWECLLHLAFFVSGCGLTVDAGFGTTGSCGFGPPEPG